MNSPAVLGLGMSSIGIIILTDFSLQIHLCFRFTQNSRQITEFIKDLSCTTLRFHRIFTWEKIKGGVEILSHFLQFESWQVTPSNFVLETFFVIFKSVTEQVFTYFYNFWPKKPDYSDFLWEIVFVYKSFAVRELQVSVKTTCIHNWNFL